MLNTRLTNRLQLAAMTALVLIPGAVSALAGVPAPQPGLGRGMAPWLGFLIIFVLLAIIMGVSLMPSKRSHQD